MKSIKLFLRLWRDQAGSVGMVFVLMTPVIIAMFGFAIEYGNALAVRTQSQRIADAAAYSAALAYNTGTSSSDSLARAQSAANRIVAINGLSAITPTVIQTVSPVDSSRNAIRVSFTQNVPLVFASLLAGKYTQGVAIDATAELISTTGPNCIVATGTGSPGITLSGGTNITAASCGVASNGNITISNCGPYIKTNSASYNGTLAIQTNCGNFQIRKADNSQLTAANKPVTDPYATNASIATATARLATVTALTSPAGPAPVIATGGKPIVFRNSNFATTSAEAVANGCIATISSNTWTYNCPAGSTKQISTISIEGGISVQFNVPVAGNANVPNATNVLAFNTGFTGQNRVTFGQGTFNIKGDYTGGSGGTVYQGIALNMTGKLDPGSSGTSTFSGGTYNIQRGIYLNGSATVTFGSGTFNIGSGTTACSGSGLYSICALTSGGVTFAGPSTFVLAAGMRTGGGAALTLGSGDGNSYNIGTSSDGYAFRGDGGAKTIMADGTVAGNLYQFLGNVNLTGGGSCLIIGAAPQHDIKGSLWATGALKLGAGIYTVTGSVNLGYSGGGDSSCGGSTIGLSANNVTLVIGAASGSLAASGSCAGSAFCVGAGYSNVVLNAPTTGATAGFAVIGPTSATNTATGIFTAGATGTTITGTFYMPNGALTFNGGATLNNAVGGCLEIIGKSISVTQGGLVGSTCVSGGGGAASFRVKLVG